MRIIGGRYRGQRIRVPQGGRTRPTSDRVREAIFDMLGDVPRGVVVLDLYAGSGALGLEALSRGSDRAIFVDSSREACRIIRDNAEALGVTDKCLIMKRDVEEFLRRYDDRERRAQLIFMDPPYARGFPRGALDLLLSWSGLGDPALIVMEMASSSARALEESGTFDENLTLMRRRNYSHTAVVIFRFSAGREN